MNVYEINGSIDLPATEEKAYAQTNGRLNRLDARMDQFVRQLNNDTDTKINAMTRTLNAEIASVNNQLAEQTSSVQTALIDTCTELETLVSSRLQAADSRIDAIIAHNNDTEGNTELLDIRTAVDGRTYQSAGTAVREQMCDTNTLLKKVDNEVFSTSLQVLELTYTLGYQHVNGSYSESELYSHTDISVHEGDVFYISGWSFYNVLLFAVLDSNGHVLRQEQESGSGVSDSYTDFKVIMPAGASVLRVNRRETPQQSNFIPTVKKEVKTARTAAAIEQLSDRISSQSSSADDRFDALESALYSRTRALVDMDSLHTGMMIKTWVNTAHMDTPSTYLGGNSNRIYTDIYPVTHGDIICSAYEKKGQMNFTYMLFDINGNYASTGTTVCLTVPADGYIIFDFPNALLLPEGIVLINSESDHPFPVPYRRNRFRQNPDPDQELPLENIDKTGGYTAIFHDIGIIGDSLACGCMEGVDELSGNYCYTDAPDYSWGACIARTTGCHVHTFCRGGQYLHDNNWYQEWKQAVAAQPCTAYIIQIGFNDYNWLRQSADHLGSLSDLHTDFETNPNTFYGQYGKMVAYILSVQPKAKIFLVNMEWNATDQSDINTAISEICEYSNQCYLIDLCTYAHEPYWNVPNLYKTGLYHKNTLGYQKTAWDIMSYIDYIVRHSPEDFIDVQFIGTSLRLPTQAEINNQ